MAFKGLAVAGILVALVSVLAVPEATLAGQVIPCPQVIVPGKAPGAVGVLSVGSPPNVLNPCPGWEWAITLGTSGDDFPHSLWTTPDGGLVLSAATQTYDSWWAKMDLNGTILVQSEEVGNSVRPTSDGGYVLAGGGSGLAALNKFDRFANAQWQRTYRVYGSACGLANEVGETPTGDLVVGGWTCKPDAYTDYWVFKTDSAGNHLWTRVLGRAGTDQVNGISPTSDGGVVVVGYSDSNYPWIVKLDADGNVAWQSRLSGGALLLSIRQAADGGYVATGRAAGAAQVLAMRLAPTGALQWQKVYSTKYGGFGTSIYPTSDGGAVIAGDLFTGRRHDQSAATVLRIDSIGNLVWQRTYSWYSGAGGSCMGDCIVQTSDGGFAMAVMTSEFGAGGYDVLLLRMAPDGSVSPTCPPSIGQSTTSTVSNGKLKATSPTFSQDSPTPTVAANPHTHPDVPVSASLVCKL